MIANRNWKRTESLPLDAAAHRFCDKMLAKHLWSRQIPFDVSKVVSTAEKKKKKNGKVCFLKTNSIFQKQISYQDLYDHHRLSQRFPTWGTWEISRGTKDWSHMQIWAKTSQGVGKFLFLCLGVREHKKVGKPWSKSFKVVTFQFQILIYSFNMLVAKLCSTLNKIISVNKHHHCDPQIVSVAERWSLFRAHKWPQSNSRC